MPQHSRKRPRRDSLRIKDAEIVDRVLDFYERDSQEMSDDREVRLQRYAKYRMWIGADKDWPWPHASNIALPDMAEKSLRLQDTLVNAVMAVRPPIGSKAHNPADKGKQEKVDGLLDFQFFVEQRGEDIIAELADAFANGGVADAFIPWIKETREVSDVRTFDPIPDELEPAEYFANILRVELGLTFATPLDEAGWDWRVELEGEMTTAKFYTRSDDDIEMVMKREVVVYDGPRVIPIDYDDLYHPAGAANLQMPGPSNPGGASHVILRPPKPTVDEIKRLAKSGFYDLIKKDQLDALDSHAEDETNDEEEKQRNTLAGRTVVGPPDKARAHRRLTMLICFDMFDVDGDGIAEDVIWWVIKETKTLVKAKLLTEMYPSNPPRRPFASKSMIPVPGRRVGIGMLEMTEALHDQMKTTLDMTFDGAALRIAPPGFYRPQGGVKPEVIRLNLGELYPLGDPSRDIKFMEVPADIGTGINLYSLLAAMQEKVTQIGDIQQGRVPPGRSAALRTAAGLDLLARQGESRPERILRRFFSLLTEIWLQMHELNQEFLPKDKQFRIIGTKPDEDPYQSVTDKSTIKGRFQFDFSANVINTQKAQLGQALRAWATAYISETSVQMGLVQPDGVYRLLRDLGKADGIDPDNYLPVPPPDLLKPKISAEEALQSIANSVMPFGVPAEGAEAHLEALQVFIDDDSEDGIGMLDPDQTLLLKAWGERMAARLEEERRQQELALASGGFGADQQPGQPGRPVENVPDVSGQPPQVSGGAELLDETLPGAGGGAVQ